jgi:long-chain acyl-CoA synthetase
MLATLRATRPTEFVAVPRVYEKFKEVVEAQLRSQSGTSMINSVYEWAKRKGFENTLASLEGEKSPFGYNLARLMVLQKIKKDLGLDKVE